MLHTKRAIKDILSNRFIQAVTVATIAFSVLIVCSFSLFFSNASQIVESWKKGVRIMVYLDNEATDAQRLDLKARIAVHPAVVDLRYIPRDVALELLKKSLAGQGGVLDDLEENPLPDAFEVMIDPGAANSTTIEMLANEIKANNVVTDVEYGEKWIRKVIGILNLFHVAGIGLAGLFILATIFIVGNTIRLMIYSRKEEIEIMRLIGASDAFIKTPFYIQGIIQGLAGGLAGMFMLFILYLLIVKNLKSGFLLGTISIHFFSFSIILGIIACSTLVGWLGGFLSLRQFFKDS